MYKWLLIRSSKRPVTKRTRDAPALSGFAGRSTSPAPNQFFPRETAQLGLPYDIVWTARPHGFHTANHPAVHDRPTHKGRCHRAVHFVLHRSSRVPSIAATYTLAHGDSRGVRIATK
eukprot:7344090-Pyramimonas_sp.AAC.4